MKQNVVHLDNKQLESGMKLAEPVYSAQGMLLLNKETVLDEKQIAGLILLDTRDVFVWQEDFLLPDDSEEKQTVFQTLYRETVLEVEQFLQETKQTKKLDQQKIIRISEELMENFSDPQVILQYLDRLKDQENANYNHSLNVALIAHLFAVWLNLPDILGKELVLTALVHDIGKAFLPPEQEQHHPILGAKFLGQQKASKAVQMGVLMHHEKEDGTGYPTGTSWWSIHPFAKIISIANFYDHTTNPQNILQQSICPFNFIRVLEGSRYGIFDIKYLDRFLSRIADYCLGQRVRLSNGKIAKIVFINRHALASPIVQTREGFIDLYREKDLQIKELL